MEILETIKQKMDLGMFCLVRWSEVDIERHVWLNQTGLIVSSDHLSEQPLSQPSFTG